MPRVIPRGLAFPPVEDEDNMTGNKGQIQGAKIVMIPEMNAKSSNINILIAYHKKGNICFKGQNILSDTYCVCKNRTKGVKMKQFTLAKCLNLLYYTRFKTKQA